MQTFLPSPDFAASAACLDRQRLGKQRIEAKQMLMAILGESKGYRAHPCTRAWERHPEGLAVYGLYVSAEWRDRGYVDNQFEWFQEKRLEIKRGRIQKTRFPAWILDPVVHEAFRECLIFKDPDHYGPQFPETDEPFEWDTFPWEVLNATR